MLVELKRVKQTESPRDFMVVHVRFQYKNKNIGNYCGRNGKFLEGKGDIVTGIIETNISQITNQPKYVRLEEVSMICYPHNHCKRTRAWKRKAVFEQLVKKFVASIIDDKVLDANGGDRAIRTKFWDKYKENMRLQ